MPSETAHTEHHFKAREVVRDLVLGISDGLTVPFALAAGLSSATLGNNIVVIAGLAELAAGAISMGLGGYLAGLSDVQHYLNEKKREEDEIRDVPLEEEKEVLAILAGMGLDAHECEILMAGLKRKPDVWRDFMMKFELRLEEPAPRRALQSGLTIGLAYVFGGFIPLFPYFLTASSNKALSFSAVVTLIALLCFGFLKGKVVGSSPLRSAAEAAFIGTAAACTAYFIARVISGAG